MYSNDDISSLHNFLSQTPEGALRKMLMGGEVTETHFRVLVKLAKGGPEAEFIENFNSEGFGKLKLSTNENKVKDNFWPICKKKLSSLGLLGQPKAA